MSAYKEEGRLVAYCGLYCHRCDWYTGVIREAAGQLLGLMEKHDELAGIAKETGACDFEEFMRGLRWLSQAIICMGCRAGGGWPDCPIRRCCVEKGISFCYERADFPCPTLEKFPEFVRDLREIRDTGLEDWIKRKWE